MPSSTDIWSWVSCAVNSGSCWRNLAVRLSCSMIVPWNFLISMISPLLYVVYPSNCFWVCRTYFASLDLIFINVGVFLNYSVGVFRYATLFGSDGNTEWENIFALCCCFLSNTDGTMPSLFGSFYFSIFIVERSTVYMILNITLSVFYSAVKFSFVRPWLITVSFSNFYTGFGYTTNEYAFPIEMSIKLTVIRVRAITYWSRIPGAKGTRSVQNSPFSSGMVMY